MPDTIVFGGPKEGAGPPELTAEAGAEAGAEVEDVAAVDPEADAAVGLGLLLVSNASVEVEGVGVDVEEVDGEEVEVVVEEVEVEEEDVEEPLADEVDVVVDVEVKEGVSEGVPVVVSEMEALEDSARLRVGVFEELQLRVAVLVDEGLSGGDGEGLGDRVGLGAGTR